jgi:hypothetical protein
MQIFAEFLRLFPTNKRQWGKLLFCLVVKMGEVKGESSVFADLDANELPTVIEDSFCMNCHRSGTTKLLLVRIPFFREIIVSAFECPHCGNINNEVQPAAQIQERGCKITLKISDKNVRNQHHSIFAIRQQITDF